MTDSKSELSDFDINCITFSHNYNINSNFKFTSFCANRILKSCAPLLRGHPVTVTVMWSISLMSASFWRAKHKLAGRPQWLMDFELCNHIINSIAMLQPTNASVTWKLKLTSNFIGFAGYQVTGSRNPKTQKRVRWPYDIQLYEESDFLAGLLPVSCWGFWGLRFLATFLPVFHDLKNSI